MNIHFLRENIPGLASPLRIEGPNYILSLAGDDSNGALQNYSRTYLSVWNRATGVEVHSSSSVGLLELHKWLTYVIEN